VALGLQTHGHRVAPSNSTHFSALDRAFRFIDGMTILLIPKRSFTSNSRFADPGDSFLLAAGIECRALYSNRIVIPTGAYPKG
jgi:hypothetical protein